MLINQSSPSMVPSLYSRVGWGQRWIKTQQFIGLSGDRSCSTAQTVKNPRTFRPDLDIYPS